MKSSSLRYILCSILFLPLSLLAEEPAETIKTAWGEIQSAAAPQVFRFLLKARPADGRLAVPGDFPHIIGCWANEQPVSFTFNQDATQIHLLLPEDSSQSAITVQTAEKSKQLADGRIVFHAVDADVVGKTAKLESHPGSDRIGFWSNAEDYVAWDFAATRWGMYRVLLTYSTAAPTGTEVEIEIAGGEPAVAKGVLNSTGSWYRYTTLDFGKVYLSTAGKKRVTVKCTKKVGGAVMNLKAVILEPACEGTPPVQAEDGSVTLHAKDSIVQGVTLRWEPAEKKQTLGYWVNPQDFARWEFTLNEPGTFAIEVWQGCGAGQGGSEMQISGSGEPIPWKVEETGHFQNFKPRVVGKMTFPTAGAQQLAVGPTKIARSAACDIRQIRLIPAK